jgi:hypothetical protein
MARVSRPVLLRAAEASTPPPMARHADRRATTPSPPELPMTTAGVPRLWHRWRGTGPCGPGRITGPGGGRRRLACSQWRSCTARGPRHGTTPLAPPILSIRVTPAPSAAESVPPPAPAPQPRAARRRRRAGTPRTTLPAQDRRASREGRGLKPAAARPQTSGHGSSCRRRWTQGGTHPGGPPRQTPTWCVPPTPRSLGFRV